MSAFDELKQKSATKIVGKQTSGVSAFDALKSKSAVVTPPVPKEESGGFGGFIKDMVRAPATILARPFQFGAQLAGVSPETLDKFSKEKLGGVVAPVPRETSDVIKDVGRGVETVAFGIGGGGAKAVGSQLLKQSTKQAVKKGAIEGTKAGLAFGVAQPLEEKGSDVTAGDVLKGGATGSAFGGATGAVVPVVGAGIKRGFGAVKSKIAERAVNKADELSMLQKGTTDARIASKALEDGKIVTDKVAKEAIRQGIPEADVALIKGGSATDKSKMAKMLGIRETQLTNKRVTARATDIVGDTFVNNIAKPIEKLNKEAGQKLNVVAQKLAGKKVDTLPAVEKFATELQGKGITIGRGNVLNFKGSDFEGIKGAQTLIQNVWNRAIKVAKSGDALQAHRTKSFIDEIVNYGKEAEGLSGRAQTMLKSFRHALDESLDVKFPEYNKVNTQFAETITQLNNIGAALGKSFRLGDTFADAKSGVALRRILSNTQSRAEILRLLDGMQTVAKKYGIKIDDDVITQANFADVLEKILGSEAPTSLLGQFEKGLESFGSSSGYGGIQQVGSSAGEFARGNLIRGTIKAGGAIVESLRGISQKNKLEALRALLNVEKKGFGAKSKVFSGGSIRKIDTNDLSPKKSIFGKIKDIPNKEGGMISTLPVYKETGNLTTKILKELEGKSTVSKQYILDATNRGELKQVERELTREVLNTMKGDTINVKEFANKVKAELLPLKVVDTGKNIPGNPTPRYESITLPSEIRGKVKNYSEHIYQSPIKTSAGQTHFGRTTFDGKKGSTADKYFGHTRIEDMADNKTRRVIEVQSDLYQKGNLDYELEKQAKGISKLSKEVPKGKQLSPYQEAIMKMKGESAPTGISKLQQYNDPTAHFRMVREEIKKAAEDGKTKLQFPTGETAMKVEGLVESHIWHDVISGNKPTIENLKIGQELIQGIGPRGDAWIITDVLGDGKFKAVDSERLWTYASYLDKPENATIPKLIKAMKEQNPGRQETFDISGKIDISNPIYKFYEKDMQKYLNKFGGKIVKDEKGVEWIEIPIKKEMSKQPVEAFGKIATNPLFIGAGASAAAFGASQYYKNKKK